MNIQNIKTLGELKKSGYKPLTVKEELRKTCCKKYRQKKIPSVALLATKIR